jgi:hypothetical protein
MGEYRVSVERLKMSRIPAGLVWILPILGVFCFSWQPVGLTPGHGLDASWSAGLSMAIHMGIGFGNHLVFTYGPLGFLGTNQLWYASTGELSFLYLIAVRLVLAAAVYLAARRNYGTVGGFVIAVLVIATVGSDVAIAAFIVAIWFLEHPPSTRICDVLMVCGGALAAFELLIKASVGVALAVMVAVVASTWTGSRRRHVVAASSSFVLALLVGWMASGQSLSALPDYMRNSARIVSGYSSAMVVDEPTIRWEYTAAMIAFSFGLVCAVYSTIGALDRRRAGAVALWVAFAYFEFKEGFQRHDAPHGAIYFDAILGGFVAFRFRAGSRLIGLGLLGALLAFALAAQDQTLASAIDPSGNAEMAVTQIKQVLDPSERNRTIAAGRAEIVSTALLDTKTLALLQDKTVAVAPYESALAWAYRIRWMPLPVFQSYAAYTTGLDQLNANTVASGRAPERILLSASPGIDGRVAQFDEPLTERTILCRYQELYVGSWDVLGRGPNRCGQPVALSTVKAKWGQQVAVTAPPNDHTLVMVRIGGVQVGGLERLRTLVYKARERFVLIDGVSHRLVPGTAGDGLVLRAPAGVDFSPPFAVAPNATSISVELQGRQPGGHPITYSFYEVPVSVGPRYAPLQQESTGGALNTTAHSS